MNQVQIVRSVIGKLQVPSSPWLMLGGLQFECARVLHEALLVTILLNGSETIRKEKESSSIGRRDNAKRTDLCSDEGGG